MASNNIPIDDLQINIEVNSLRAQSNIDLLAKSLKEVGSSGSELQKVVIGLQDLGNAASQSEKVIAKTGEKIKDTGDNSSSAGSKIRSTSSDLKNMAKSANHSTSALGNLISSFKRIAMYRALRSIIKAITQGFSEGVKNFTQWDAAFNNNGFGAVATMNEIKSLSQQITNSLGAMAMPIIQLVLPALRMVANVLMDIANFINQIARTFQGEKDYMRAVYTEVDYLDDSLGRASGRAKELKRVLFGFDELNILPSITGSSGGSGTSLLDMTPDLFKKTDTAGWLQNIVDEVKKFNLKNKLEQFILTAAYMVRDLFTWIGQHIVKPAIDWLNDNVFRPIGNWISTAASNIAKFFSDIWNDINKWFGSLFTAKFWQDLWYDIDSWLVKPFKEFLNWINHEEIEPKTDSSHILDLGKTYSKTRIGIKENPVEVNTIADPKPLKNLLDTTLHVKDEIDNTKFSPKFEIQSLQIDALKKIPEQLSRGLSPITLLFQFNTRTLPSAMAYIWDVMQKAFYKAPLQMPTVITNSTQQTFAGKALLNSVKFASGGVPDVGTLFYAGEAGAEVVANMNGRTQVLNTDQMSDAIANGNVDVVNAIYALMNTMVSTVNGKSFDIYMDSAKVGKSVTAYQTNQARRGIATQGVY